MNSSAKRVTTSLKNVDQWPKPIVLLCALVVTIPRSGFLVRLHLWEPAHRPCRRHHQVGRAVAAGAAPSTWQFWSTNVDGRIETTCGVT